ncbi:hypothetical protein H2200_003058 [Cladophialophora chaetospira]|uniref:Uncharacterized protein n=1 Tax=Cladophialophora chaetospira TaxID=386627 RepID=A0AA39CLX7_9EURO|nr:hypothetical protein H2200_003058 [Cladophialophora chaetospira]
MEEVVLEIVESEMDVEEVATSVELVEAELLLEEPIIIVEADETVVIEVVDKVDIDVLKEVFCVTFVLVVTLEVGEVPFADDVELDCKMEVDDRCVEGGKGVIKLVVLRVVVTADSMPVELSDVAEELLELSELVEAIDEVVELVAVMSWLIESELEVKADTRAEVGEAAIEKESVEVVNAVAKADETKEDMLGMVEGYVVKTVAELLVEPS